MKTKLLFILLILFMISLSACGSNDLYFNTNTTDVQVYVDNIIELPYNTNIKNLQWSTSDPDVATVEDGVVLGVGEGFAFITVEYKNEQYAEYLVEVIKKKYEVVYRTLLIDGDPYTVRNQSIILTNLHDYFGENKTHLEYDDATFVGWYLDKQCVTKCDLNMEITDDMAIYSKYKSLEIESNIRINIDNVIGYKGKFVNNADIQTFSPAYGTYATNDNNDFSNYTFVICKYDINKKGYFITDVMSDGAKKNVVIPYNGFIICVNKYIDTYNKYMNNFTIGAEISLSKYSVNTSNILYVNEVKEKIELDKLIVNGLNARFVSVYDVRNDQTILDLGGDEKAYPASVTKIITAITALRYAKLEDKITVGEELDITYEGSSPSTAGIQKGEIWTLRQLLYALLLPSGNDAGYEIAALTINSIYPDNSFTGHEKIAKFADLMNETAQEVGAVNSHFMTPDGNSYYKSDGSWDERISEHYVTANDMCKFANYALALGAIAETVSTKTISYQIESKRTVSFTNTNKFIKTTDYYYIPSAIGVKTGTTTPAGNCLVSAVEINRRFIIVAVLKAPTSDDRYSNSLKIYEAIFGDALR